MLDSIIQSTLPEEWGLPMVTGLAHITSQPILLLILRPILSTCPTPALKLT